MHHQHWSGYFNHLPLAEALEWRRREFGGSLDDAFAELVKVIQSAKDRRVVATGVMCLHACPDKEIERYRWGIDPPTSHKTTTHALATMPIAEWADVLPVVDAAGAATSNLKCSSCRRPAWLGVEFLDMPALVNEWRAQFQLGIKPQHPASASPAPTQQKPKPVKPISPVELTRYLQGIKNKGGSIPAIEKLFKQMPDEYPDYRVTRSQVQKAHEDVFGKLPPGRRPRSNCVV